MLAIINATLITASGPVIEKGTIIVAEGKIKAIGKNLTLPKEAEVLDA